MMILWRRWQLLGTTVNHYNSASKELNKIDKDVTRITGEGMELDLKQIDKPTVD
jgi:hypothetical protein